MIDKKLLLDSFLEYIRIDSEAGNELPMAQRLLADLKEIGCEITTDNAGEAVGSNGFNIYATLPGDPALEPLMFSAHMDTVVPGKGIQPVIGEDGIIRAAGDTILAADDKAGLCAIVAALREAAKVPHRTVEAVFTISEEVGLLGAKNLDYSRIRSKKCVVLDSDRSPARMGVGGPGQNSLRATITGRKAHAGVEPENGISAIQAAAHAVAAMQLLRVDFETTCNIGTFRAEGPTNIVSDHVELVMEVRSRNTDKLVAHTQHIIDCMQQACDRFGAKLEYQVNTMYLGFELKEDHPLVQQVSAALRQMGLEPKLELSGGGSDSNIYVQHGIPTVNIGVGMDKAHTSDEWLCISEMEDAAEVCLRLMQA